MEKVCTLVNSRFCWILKVDGKEIPFQGADSADYFAVHYGLLGYKINREKEE